MHYCRGLACSYRSVLVEKWAIPSDDDDLALQGEHLQEGVGLGNGNHVGCRSEVEVFGKEAIIQRS